MIYIDNSNLFRTLREIDPNRNMDFAKLQEVLAAGRDLVATKLYASEKDPPVAAQSSFYRALQYMGIQVTLLKLKNYGGRLVEKGLDMALGLDMFADAFRNHFDVAILVAGDQDYVRLVTKVRSETGRKVELAFFGKAVSDELRRSAQRFHNFEPIFDSVTKIREGQKEKDR
jgi:uncharacterized LabA/DUF88 family protein